MLEREPASEMTGEGPWARRDVTGDPLSREPRDRIGKQAEFNPPERKNEVPVMRPRRVALAARRESPVSREHGFWPAAGKGNGGLSPLSEDHVAPVRAVPHFPVDARRRAKALAASSQRPRTSRARTPLHRAAHRM